MKTYKDVREMLVDFFASSPRPLRGPREHAEWADLPGEKFIAEVRPEQFVVVAVTSADITVASTIRAPGYPPWQSMRFLFATELTMGPGETLSPPGESPGQRRS